MIWRNPNLGPFPRRRARAFTIEGTAVASRAGQLGLRKTAATRIAQRMLHETIVSGNAATMGNRGTVQEGNAVFEWEVFSTPWEVDNLDAVTVLVTFDVQGQTFDLELTTLLDSAAESSLTSG
jgi:hypothetical protein